MIARRNADGTFPTTATLVPIAAPDPGVSVVTADFNHDGKIDLAFQSGGQVYVVLNTTPTAACKGPDDQPHGYSLPPFGRRSENFTSEHCFSRHVVNRRDGEPNLSRL